MGISFAVPKAMNAAANAHISATCNCTGIWHWFCNQKLRQVLIRQGDLHMKYSRILICSSAFVFCMAITANAQLLGGTLKSGTSATGTLSGRGGLLGSVNSSTQAGANLGGDVQGGMNSSTQAAAKADKKNHDKSASKDNQTMTTAQSQIESTTQAGVQAGRQTATSSQNGNAGHGSSTNAGLSSDASANARVGGASAGVDSSSNANANSQSGRRGTSSQVQASSEINTNASVNHTHHSDHDKK